MNGRLSRRDALRSAASILTAAPLLRAWQQPAGPSPTFSSSVRVVNVFATVRNRKGALVTGLDKEDFEISEEGRPQIIRYFSRETDLPLTLGFLVDTSGSTRNVLPDERGAARAFITQNLREDKDQAFVIHFDREVELLRDLTNSKARLATALGQLEPNDWRSAGGQGGQGGGWRGLRHGGTLLYDAVLLASNDLMKKQQGRKALILLSDGDDRGSKTSLTHAIESAQRADTLVYTLYFKGEEIGYGPRGGAWGGRRGRYPAGQNQNREGGKKIMEQIARETGGGFYEITSKHPVDKAFASLEEELRNQYSLGYTPDTPPATGDFRRIAVSTRNSNLSVQARTGYFAT